MLRRFLSITSMCAAVAVSAGCEQDNRLVGSGVVKTETRELDTFDRILIEGGARIVVTIGEPRPLTVSADDNILAVLKTTVVDGLLLIKPDVSIKPDTPIVLTIQIPALSEIACRGAADMRLSGIDNKTLTIDIDGAGKVHATGRTDELVVKADGAGSLSLADLESRNASVNISGAGSVTVNATDKLVVSISGAARVQYVGDPKIEKHVSGVGVISKLGK